MFVNPQGSVMLEDGDECNDCRKVMRQKVKCPLILALGMGVVFIDEEEGDGSVIVHDCPMYEKKNLKVVEDGRDGE